MPKTQKIYELTIYTKQGEILRTEIRLPTMKNITEELAWYGQNGFAYRPKGEIEGVYWPPANLQKITYREIKSEKA